MRTGWQKAVLCLCVLVVAIHSAAVPTQTQDTLVVARSEEHNEASTALAVEEATTEKSSPPVKLTEMEVTSTIASRYAHTAVVTRVRNPAKRAQETTFRILLPETAFISGFIMTLDGKPYKAYVKEKEEAKKIYDDAVASGVSAAVVASKARDSNQFTVTVNLEPNTLAIFNLTYEELLVRRNSVYNQAINLHPGALVPKLTVTVNIHEAQKITVLRVPEVRTGNEIDATAEDTQNSKAVITRGHDDREATITFKPDLEEQKRLIGIYMEKSKESHSAAGMSYNSVEGGNQQEQGDGILGQFVVQYDVERPKNGEILVNNGYFVHFFAPEDLPPLNKHVVFVLDTSGSMMDRKIVQLRQAMQTILSELNKGDYFNIVEFASSAKVHQLKEADEEPPKRMYYGYDSYPPAPPTLVPPSPVTPENIAKAKTIISRLEAGGGTNIYSALDVAVELVKKGLLDEAPADNVASPTYPTHSSPNSDAPSTAATTQAQVSTTQKSEEAKKEAHEIESKDKAIKLEPIIIFLTDGDPTVGETNPTTIINHLTEKNYGENKATIFSLAFGEDADRKFLRKISLRNDGFMRHIYEAADAALQLHDFYRQVSSPLLAHVKFTYPRDQVKLDSLTKHTFRTFYAGSEAVVAGRVEEAATEITPQIDSFCGNLDEPGRKKYEVTLKAPVAQTRTGYLPLERLWAYLTVKQLLDQRDAQVDVEQSEDKDKTPDKKALAIALKYELVTPVTSLVVVKPNATNAVNAESVDKANGPSFGGAPLSAFYSGPPSTYRPGSGGYAHFASYAQPGIPSYHPSAGSLAFDSGAFDTHVEAEAFEDIGDLETDDKVAYITTPRIDLDEDLRPYHMEGFTWILPLLHKEDDTIKVPVNDTTISLKLSKDDQGPKSSGSDPPCSNALNGSDGTCVYLRRCGTDASNITPEIYAKAMCTLDSGYAGVCCRVSVAIDLANPIDTHTRR